jgi:hypothetical protein
MLTLSCPCGASLTADTGDEPGHVSELWLEAHTHKAEEVRAPVPAPLPTSSWLTPSQTSGGAAGTTMTMSPVTASIPDGHRATKAPWGRESSIGSAIAVAGIVIVALVLLIAGWASYNGGLAPNTDLWPGLR